MQKLVGKYNKEESILFISSFPEKGVKYSNKVCAIGGFAKNTTEALKKEFLDKGNQKNIIVLTVIINKREIYEENGTLICRVIDKKNPLSYFEALKLLSKFTNVKKTIIEFEFGSFGSIINAGFFLSIPFFLKLLGKKQYLILHQIVDDLQNLAGHLGWEEKNFKVRLFNFFLRAYYGILGHLAARIIVLEDVFKKRLEKIVGFKDKTLVISHGVDTKLSILDKQKSRKVLGFDPNKRIILYFGYLTWYKGADLFLDFAKNTKSNKYQFIIAGGPSFTNNSKKYYKTYLKKFDNLPKNIFLTGFVPEDKISLYFSAADIVVLPYRTMMSSSGPLSLAFSFEKPVLLSKQLLPYSDSQDFNQALTKTGLNVKDLFFDLTKKNFFSKLSTIKEEKLHQFSRLLRENRSYTNLAKKYILAMR